MLGRTIFSLARLLKKTALASDLVSVLDVPSINVNIKSLY